MEKSLCSVFSYKLNGDYSRFIRRTVADDVVVQAERSNANDAMRDDTRKRL
jgi:hypothetical protein